MYNIFIQKIEKLLNTIFQRMFVFRFLLVLFFRYYLITLSMKCSVLTIVIETHFNINTLYELLFMSCVSDFKRHLFTLIILFICLLPFCLDFVLFHEALLLKLSSNLRENSFTHLRHFLTSLPFAFIEK